MRKISAYGPSLVVLFTAVVVLIVGPHAVRVLTDAQTEARIIRASARLTESTAVLDQINQAYQDIATVVEPSVVHISAERPPDPDFSLRPRLFTGSGWVWDELGHVVTNYHVVQDSIVIDVQLYNGTPRKAMIVGFDELTDVAVLKIDGGGLFPARRVESSYDVQQGDMVFAFGSPFDFRFSMSSGVVSGKGRSVGVIRPFGGSFGYENFIQVDAAINPGNSGGPLTNHRGEVVGMNTAIATRAQGGFDEGQFAGIGLAIPMSMIEPVVTQVIDNNGVVVKGYLGVRATDLGEADIQKFSMFGLTGQGVHVFYVDPESPAARGGVMIDDIIQRVNNVQIRSMNQLQSVISSTLPGQSIELNVWRPDDETATGRAITFSIKLDQLNELLSRGRVPTHQPADRLVEIGIMKMATATEPIARELGVEFRRGVIIQELVQDTALAYQIAPGTVIVSVGGSDVRDVNELFEALRRFDLLRHDVRIGVYHPSGDYDDTVVLGLIMR